MNKFQLLGVVCLSAALLSGCGSAQGTESSASASGSDGSGLASSSAPADNSFALSPEKQLQVMADHVQDWQVADEWDWWGYTVGRTWTRDDQAGTDRQPDPGHRGLYHQHRLAGQ